MKDISKDLKEFFKKKGLTQQQIADILGVSQAYIGYLIRGEKPFGKKQAEKFSNLFGFNPSWLLTGEGEMLRSDTTFIQGYGNAVNGSTINEGASEGIIGKLLEELAAQRMQNQELIEIIKKQLENGK